MPSHTSQLTTSTIVYTYAGSSIPGLKAQAKRYVPCIISDATSLEFGLTLVFAHCLGSHKEAWEPIIQSLFNLRVPKDSPNGPHVPVVREAWSLEWQHHGDSASLNHSTLASNRTGVSIHEWARAVRHLVTSNAMEGHRIVGIGHSAGACAILRSAMSLAANDGSPYVSIIVVEDAFVPRALWAQRGDEIQRNVNALLNAIDKRHDLWENRQKARESLSKHRPWRSWDKRALDLFTRHAIRDTSPSESSRPMVTLACNKLHEQACYSEHEDELYCEAVDYAAALDPNFDIHCIYGEKQDFIPSTTHASFLTTRAMTSIHRVPNAGHYVVQENPEAVSLCLSRILFGIASDSLRSKL